LVWMDFAPHWAFLGQILVPRPILLHSAMVKSKIGVGAGGESSRGCCSSPCCNMEFEVFPHVDSPHLSKLLRAPPNHPQEPSEVWSFEAFAYPRAPPDKILPSASCLLLFRGPSGTAAYGLALSFAAGMSATLKEKDANYLIPATVVTAATTIPG
jgi:hypothetical protein